MDMTCPKQPIKMDAHIEITCKVLSKTFDKITWFHNGQPISKQGKNHVKVDRKSCHQILKIKVAKTSDGGNYTCQVANDSRKVNKTCVLEVEGKSSLVDVKVYICFSTGLVIVTYITYNRYGGIPEVSRVIMQNSMQNPELRHVVTGIFKIVHF